MQMQMQIHSAQVYGGIDNYYGLSIGSRLWVFDENNQQMRSREFSEPIRKAIIAESTVLVLLESGNLQFSPDDVESPTINLTKVRDIHDMQIPDDRNILILYENGDLVRSDAEYDDIDRVISNVKSIQGSWVITIRSAEYASLWVPSPMKLSSDSRSVLETTSKNGFIKFPSSFDEGEVFYASETKEILPATLSPSGKLIWGDEIIQNVIKFELLGARLAYLTSNHQLSIIDPQGRLKISEVIDFTIISKGILYVTRDGLFRNYLSHTKRILKFCQTPARDGRCEGELSESYLDSLGAQCCRQPKTPKPPPMMASATPADLWETYNFHQFPAICDWNDIEFLPAYQVADRGVPPSTSCMTNETLLSPFMPSREWIKSQKYYLDHLSEEDRQFVRFYSHRGDRAVNSFIREGDQITPDLQSYITKYSKQFGMITDISAYLARMRDRLTQIIMNAPPTTEEFYVYRGTILDVYQTDQKRVYISQGFFSTSLFILRARNFSRHRNLVRIKLPIGARVIFPDTYSVYSGEAEILLPDQSKFYLVSRWKPQTYTNFPYEATLRTISIPTLQLSLIEEPSSFSIDDQTPLPPLSLKR